jgi:hypothetical protein
MIQALAGRKILRAFSKKSHLGTKNNNNSSIFSNNDHKIIPKIMKILITKRWPLSYDRRKDCISFCNCLSCSVYDDRQ